MENFELYLRWFILVILGFVSIYSFFKEKTWKLFLNKPIRAEIKAIRAVNDNKISVSLQGIPENAEIDIPASGRYLIHPGKTYFMTGDNANRQLWAMRDFFLR